MNGKVAVVTGAANGIGRHLVLALSDAGCRVWAWDIDEKGLEETRSLAKKSGEPACALRVDVTRESEVRKAVDTILKAERKIDIWVNNAGLSGIGDFHDMATESFARVIDVNLKGLILGTKIAISHMDERGGGTIVNMASVAGYLAAPYLSVYCATKFGVVGFTRALREELQLKSSSVKLLLVSPGFVDTAMLSTHESINYPPWLRWALASPEKVSRRILLAIRRGEREVVPTWNGKLLMLLNRRVPGLAGTGTKLLLADGIKDFALARFRAKMSRTHN